MKYKTTETTTVVHRERVAITICDFCGEEDDSGRGWDASSVTLKAVIGKYYPECDARDTEEFDCCPECWAYEVVPALMAIGGKIYSHHTDGNRLDDMPVVEMKP